MYLMEYMAPLAIKIKNIFERKDLLAEDGFIITQKIFTAIKKWDGLSPKYFLTDL